MELATKLLPLPELLDRYRLSSEQLTYLIKFDEQFRNQIGEYRKEWSATSNAKERVRVKAALAAEDGLLTLYGIFKNEDLNPAARLDAFKQITVLADVQPRKDAPDTGARFSVTINLGDEPEDKIVIEAPVLERELEYKRDFEAESV